MSVVCPSVCPPFEFSRLYYASAFGRLRLYVFGLSVRPSVRSMKYPHLTCTWVRWSTQPTVTVLRHVRPSVRPSVRRHTFFTMFPSWYHHEIFRIYYQWQKLRPCKRSRSKVKVTEVNTQLNRFGTVTQVWIHIWWWNAWWCSGEVPYCFSRSSVKFHSHTALKSVKFDPDWAFPDSNSSLNSPMATKWCTKLEVA